jgi:hypothetical protein
MELHLFKNCEKCGLEAACAWRIAGPLRVRFTRAKHALPKALATPFQARHFPKTRYMSPCIGFFCVRYKLLACLFLPVPRNLSPTIELSRFLLKLFNFWLLIRRAKVNIHARSRLKAVCFLYKNNCYFWI